MCGFAGFVGPAANAAEQEQIVRRMAATIAHRGPDDEGAWVDRHGRAALGFRRLSILELSPLGHQPMVSADGRYVLVFNGEIYNHAAVRGELEALGVRFRGRSDTEVLLAALAQWGVEASLPRLWGMFAAALWDTQERALSLFRDRLGKKPLYYGWQGQTFLFGSELKALRAHGAFVAPLDMRALAAFLGTSYVPSPASIHQGISKLPPASWLRVRAEQPGEIAGPTCYWNVAEVAAAGEAEPLQLSDEEARDALDALLRDAVRLRMEADVPLGAFLSGGVDSSAVVALMQAQSARRVRTFTIGFAEGEYDESAPAAAVAAHLGTDHTTLRVTAQEALDVIPRLPELYDEPFADSSQIPTHLVARLARQHVTVALSGDGGDEVLGGYQRYVTGARLWSHLGRWPVGLRGVAARGVTLLGPAVWDRLGGALDHLLPARRAGLVSGNKVQKLASILASDSLEAMYGRLITTWSNPGAVLVPPTEAAGGPGRPLLSSRLAASAHKMMLADMQGYLPDDILVKIDRASMGASLEARAPLLDHRLVELAWRLPLRQKIRGGEGKWLLRRVLDRYVPRALFDRVKHGFGVPIDAWLRGPLRGWAQDLLEPGRLRREGLFDPARVGEALEEHLTGRRNRHHELWAVLMFQAWHARR